jgi:hypothetical protein
VSRNPDEASHYHPSVFNVIRNLCWNTVERKHREELSDRNEASPGPVACQPFHKILKEGSVPFTTKSVENVYTRYHRSPFRDHCCYGNAMLSLCIVDVRVAVNSVINTESFTM